MNKTWMKLLSLLLALCTVLSLAVPAVSAEDNDETADAATEEEFVFPEFGEAYSVGEVLTGGMALTEYALLVEKNGDYFLMAAAKGGTLYVLKLSEYLRGGDGGGTFIEASVTHGIAIPRGIVMDSQGVAYVVGDGGYVFCYDFYKNTTARINLSSGSRAMTIDDEDNLYVGTEGGGSSQIIKIDLKNNNKQTVLFETNEITGCGAMHYGDGDIYMWGNPAGMPNGFHLWRIDAATGEVKAKHTNTTDKYGYYLSYIDGVLFGGHSAAMDQAWVFDAKTLEPIDVGLPDWIMGVVTTPNEEGKSYIQVNANGVFEYDTKTRTTKRVEMLNAWNINLRIRDAYLDVDFDGIKGKCIATMASGHGLPSILSIEGQGFRELEPLVEETISPATLRSVATAVAGVKVVHSDADALKGTPQEAAVYIGGYLSGNVAAYYPGAVEEELRVDSPIFTNGHAQTDSMLAYKGKLYAGCYNGGYIVQYDPVTDTDIQMIPNGLKEDYYQIRIHGLSAGDDKIFFSTIPGDQTLGGAIGWIDIPKFEAGAPVEEYLYVERNVIFEQAITSIVYDEERNILFGSSSTSGGTNTTPTQEEGLLLAYDVDNKKVLGTFSVRAEANPNSDMVWDLNAGAAMPAYLGGIARDPDTGKFWGTVSQCVFSFEYDEKTNTMKVHEEYVHNSTNAKAYYPIGGNPNWFPRPFCFDGKGHFYMWIVGGKMYRFDVNDPANPIQVGNMGTRMYALGTDGNLYIGSGLELYKLALNRVDIVKGMIDGVEPRFGDQVKLARQSYEHLTDEEKAQLSEEYVEGLAALEGAAQIFLQVQADKVADAIDEIGAVTVSSEGAIAAAREKYELLDEDAKPMVSNYQELVAMEAKFEEISAASSWGKIKQIPVSFSKKVNPRIGQTALQMTTFDHINGGIWEFGLTSSTNANVFKYNGGDHLQLNFGGGWVAFRVKISEPGLYTISMEGKGGSNVVKNGGLYIYDVTGIKTDHMYDLINNEASMRSKNTQNFVCTVDYSTTAMTEQGKWYCEAPGEYMMVLNRLSGDTGTYGRPMGFTFSKRTPVTDGLVEETKARIDAIGKVNKNSEAKINDARILYNTLSEAQKALIYAPQLEKAEEAFAEIKKLQAEKDSQNAVDAAMVKAYIDAIGTVTEKSGPAIKLARDEYDKLSKDAKELVTNKDVLIAAEEAFAKFGGQAGDGQEGGNGWLTYVLIGAGALVVILVVVLVIVKGKKKKAAPVGDGANDIPQAEEAAEEAASEEATEE